MSFALPSPDPSRFSDITVNYTVANAHSLDEGFVMRYGEKQQDGSTALRSYGEGNAIYQNMVLEPYWGSKVQQAWQVNQEQIIQGARPNP